MMTRISADRLRSLRNDIDVVAVICDLQIPITFRGRRLTFRCPGCESFHTALNPRVNLARCFRCRRNLNPIDLAMAERGWSFLETVRYLEALLRPFECPAR